MVTWEPVPEPPRLPFFTGVFRFPWYVQTLGPWVLMSIGLTVSALGVVFCIWLVDIGLALAARCFALPVFLIATLSLSYTAACCSAVIEATTVGYDEVTEWPRGFWRDWFFTVLGALGLVALALAVGGMVGKWLWPGSWTPPMLSLCLLFPIFLLSTLEAGSPMALISWPVLKSFVWVWWGWGLFYVETGLLLGVWLVLTVRAFPYQPFGTVLVSGPCLAALLLIYARLVGRLAWSIERYGNEESED